MEMGWGIIWTYVYQDQLWIFIQCIFGVFGYMTIGCEGSRLGWSIISACMVIYDEEMIV